MKQISLFSILTKGLSISPQKGGYGRFAKYVAFISVFLGSLAMVVALGILDGFDKALKENAVKFSSHVVIKPFSGVEFLSGVDETIALLSKKFDNILEIEKKVSVDGLVGTSQSTEGVYFKSIPNNLKSIKESIISGSISNDKILIGKTLANKLKVKYGDKLVLYFSENTSNTIPRFKVRQLEIGAIYETGFYEYDANVIYLDYDYLAKVLDIPFGSARSIEIILDDMTDANKVSEQIDQLLSYPHYSMSIYDLHGHQFTWIEVQKEPIPIVLAVITIVASLNIITLLLINYTEKTKQIGILKTLGLSNSFISKIFISIGLRTAILSSSTACLIGFLLLMIQELYGIVELDGTVYYMNVAPVDTKLWHYVLVFGGTVVIALVTSVLPSLIIKSYKVNEIIKFR